MGGITSPSRDNHQLESRMREIRQSGSEGGGAEFNRSSLPLSLTDLGQVGLHFLDLSFHVGKFQPIAGG